MEIAPAHYPCGSAVAGQNMEVGPGTGWANAVPDATATVKLTVGGTNLVFKGLGYHDKVRALSTITAYFSGMHTRTGATSPLPQTSRSGTGATDDSVRIPSSGSISLPWTGKNTSAPTPRRTVELSLPAVRLIASACAPRERTVHFLPS